MFYVYRGINYSTEQVYFGVSKDPVGRRNASHCVGGTKALRHWRCDDHRIRWENLSRHRDQSLASEVAHEHEATYLHPQGFEVIRTSGV